MDSWIVVTVLVVSVAAGAVSGWVLLRPDNSRRPRHQSTERPGLTRQGRHRGRFTHRLRTPRQPAAGIPVHVKTRRRTHARDDR